MVVRVGICVCEMVRFNRRAYNPWEEWEKQGENGSKKESKCNYEEKMKNILVLHDFCFTILILIFFSLFFK